MFHLNDLYLLDIIYTVYAIALKGCIFSLFLLTCLDLANSVQQILIFLYLVLVDVLSPRSQSVSFFDCVQVPSPQYLKIVRNA